MNLPGRHDPAERIGQIAGGGGGSHDRGAVAAIECGAHRRTDAHVRAKPAMISSVRPAALIRVIEIGVGEGVGQRFDNDFLTLDRSESLDRLDEGAVRIEQGTARLAVMMDVKDRDSGVARDIGEVFEASSTAASIPASGTAPVTYSSWGSIRIRADLSSGDGWLAAPASSSRDFGLVMADSPVIVGG